MNISKKLGFYLVLVSFLAVLPSNSALADDGRYFVKSTKTFWKNALGVRHQFNDGFTTDLSDFQIRLTRILGVEVEPVRVLQILPDVKTAAVPKPEDPKDGDNIADDNSINSKEDTKSDKVRISGTTRKLPSDQTPWGIEVIYNDPLIIKTSGGENVKVAVLDTGVLTNHLDLKRRITQCKDFTNFRYPVVDGKCEDKNGHGTHVAGTIAADGAADGKGIYGVAPAAKLMIYKVCGANGLCYADDISTAIRTSADQGANIINMSFGSDSPILLINDAINYAASKGVLPVAAAGNDGPFDNSLDYPAAYASVIGVGAIDQSILVTEWSSRGNNASTSPFLIEDRDIEFAAPGKNIESTYNNGGYVILSGTSMSSPFIAGLAAKFWQGSAISPAQATRDFLHGLAHDLLPVGDDNASGFGLPYISFP